MQWPLELMNTKFDLSWDFKRLKAVKELCHMPKMSTLAIGALINRLVLGMPQGQSYLNIGVWHGYSLISGMVRNEGKKCIGVDNFSEFGSPKAAFLKRFSSNRSAQHKFFEADFREYMKNHSGSVGVFFYDGSHDFESQYEALVSVEPFVAPGGLILVDDTNLEAPRKALIDFLATHPDYELAFDIRTAGNCHPTYWNGLMIARKIIDN